MLEIILFLLAAAAQSDPAGETATAAAVPAIQAPAAPAAQAARAARPATGASAEGGQDGTGQGGGAASASSAAAAPAFLAPPADDAETEPVFLAPPEPPLRPEPQVPTGRFTTAVEVRPILDATRANWIMVRDFNGQDLVYVTQIWAWRCGLAALRVGINGNPPEPWPLPPCHLDQPAPNAILPADGQPYRAFPAGSVAMVEVELVYDDLSTDRARFDRQGRPVP